MLRFIGGRGRRGVRGRVGGRFGPAGTAAALGLGAMLVLQGPAGASRIPPKAPTAPYCVVLPYQENAAGGRVPRSRPFSRGAGEPWSAPVSTTGSAHLLAILAEFSDVPHRIPPARFDELLFGAQNSLRDYYSAVSEGQLDVTGAVIGWIKLPGTEHDYSRGVGGTQSPYPDNAQKMAEDAVVAAVQAGVDLGDHDLDGDGVVDALLVVHSGQGYEWASQQDPDAINSHKWSVTDPDFGSGAQVTDYFTCPELQLIPSLAWSDSISTIGVYCHEFGHVLGLPDLYDTGTLENRVGRWDVMDYGTWNRDVSSPQYWAPGALPGRFSAWSRMFLRWVTPLTVSPALGESTTASVTVESASTGGTPLQLRSNPGGVDWSVASSGSGEYFLAEVRTRVGYDRGLPAEGLLLYHVDESQATNRESEATFRDGGLLVLLPEDDDLLISTGPSDAWPGGQDTFDDRSRPSSDLFSGEASGVTLAGIGSAGGGSVALLATVTNLGAPPTIPYARPHPWSPAVQGDVHIVLGSGASPGASTLQLFDILGRRVRTLGAPADFLEEGRVALWNGKDDAGRRLPAGIYLYRSDGAASRTGKLVLLR